MEIFLLGFFKSRNVNLKGDGLRRLGISKCMPEKPTPGTTDSEILNVRMSRIPFFLPVSCLESSIFGRTADDRMIEIFKLPNDFDIDCFIYVYSINISYLCTVDSFETVK